MGTEYSFETLRGMYQYLMKQPGFTFRELTRAVRLIIEDGSAVGVELQTRGRDPEVAEASYVVAAPGRGGADWLSKEVHLHGIGTRNNEVDIGVRVEVPNAVMDHMTTHLYEAKMVYYSDTCLLYTAGQTRRSMVKPSSTRRTDSSGARVFSSKAVKMPAGPAPTMTIS